MKTTRKDIIYYIQLVWSTGLNMVMRILPVALKSVASATEIGGVQSAYSTAKFFSVPFGIIADKIGKSKAIFYSFLATILIALLLTTSNSILFFTIVFFIFGLVSNFFYSSVNSLTTIFFCDKKVESLFKLEIFYQTGLAIGPIIGGYLLESYHLATIFYVWAFLSLLGMIISPFIKKEECKIEKTDNPKFDFKEFWESLKNKKDDFIVYLSVGSFYSGFILAVLDIALPLYLKSLNFSIVDIGKIIGFSAILGAFNLYLIKKDIDKYDHKKVMYLVFALVVLVCFGIVNIKNWIVLIIFISIFNMSRNISLNMGRGLLVDLFKDENRATSLSISETVHYGARIIAPILAGLLIDYSKIEYPFYLIIGFSALFGLALFVFSNSKLSKD